MQVIQQQSFLSLIFVHYTIILQSQRKIHSGFTEFYNVPIGFIRGFFIPLDRGSVYLIPIKQTNQI